MIRTKGEAGTGNVVEAVRHMRAVWDGIRKLQNMPPEELMKEAKELGAPYELVVWVAEHGKLPVVNFAAGGVATPADAALMMALASSTVEAQGRTIGQPEQLLTVLNSLLTARLKANRMNAALLYTVFDLSQRTMSVANAGMIAPILVRDGRVQFIETAGLPLGAFAQARYTATHVELQDGDLILLVSDGVVEARRPDGELFGFERLEQSLGNMQEPVYLEQLVDNLFAQVIHFIGEAEQHDDMTIVVIQPNLKAVTQQMPEMVGEVVV